MYREHSMASLLERVAELEAALRPFALLAGIYNHLPDDRRLLSTAIGNITAADIKRARRLVED